jgi:hypothetical protein
MLKDRIFSVRHVPYQRYPQESKLQSNVLAGPWSQVTRISEWFKCLMKTINQGKSIFIFFVIV